MYVIREVLSTSSRAELYRGTRIPDGQPVVLKVLTHQHRPEHLSWLKNEYDIGVALNTPAAVRPLALETYEGRPALVMEDFGGTSLDQLLAAPMAVGPFLQLALRIASAVADIHQRNIVHKDLKPDNILVHPTTGEVKLADFGLACPLPCPRPECRSVRRIEGSLPYMSPEQTGRMNRATDQRSDLYSLGGTFYQMLTGKLPFEAADPLEWIHYHIARSPIPPAELVPSVPGMISAVVMKLLAKEPEDRYQTARGLRHDLDRCFKQWCESGRIDEFPLGTRDISDSFRIPQKFYGRKEELAALLGAFQRVVDTGAPELMLVAGYSGIGKSSLVWELQKPILRARGFFAAGKFDQYKRDIPYATIVQAFTELVRELLAESEDQVAAWKEQLTAALGGHGQLIVEVIPPVELIIGPQPPLPALPPIEAQSRFRIAFRHFLGVFARKEHPLALFLDDLQWADMASLDLLADLLTGSETRHLLVIGAYRDNEVTLTHPLMRVLDKAKKEGVPVTPITLGPLSTEQLTTLVADTLHSSQPDAAPLARLLDEKTAGNPFFVIQFLTALYEERLIQFGPSAEAWQWDLAKIYAKGFTDNVVDLMVAKLVRLPTSTQQALRHLACLGDRAEIELLSVLSDRAEDALHADLAAAVRAGLVLRMDGAYKFPHDRIQEAAYSLLPEGERAAMHLQIGRLLLSRTAPDELAEKSFDIVNQLNRGAALITAPAERERVAELDLIAAQRAMGAIAYASALTYLAAGAALLTQDRWERRYELTFALELRRAECEFLLGELSAAEERLSMLGRHARDLVDRADVVRAQMVLHTMQGRSDRAIETGLQYLRLGGIEWPPHPSAAEVEQEYQRLRRQLDDRPVEELLELPEVTEARWRAMMDVLVEFAAPTAFSDDLLMRLVICRMVNISLEHGHCDASCYAYGLLGQILGPYFGDYPLGYRFGKLALDLLHKRRQVRFSAPVYALFGMCINFWTKPLRTSLEWTRRAVDVAVETGDLQVACCVRSSLITQLFAVGDPLADAQREAERSLAFIRKAKFELIVDVVTAQERLIRTLRGLLPAFSSFNDAEFDEERFEAHLGSNPALVMAACWYWIRKLQARFHAGDYASAVAAAAKAEQLIWTTAFVLEGAEYHFYRAMALAAHYQEASPDERRQHREALIVDLRRDLRRHLGRLQTFAKNCPENFESRASLVAAELAYIDGDTEQAAQLYEQAIRSAREHGLVREEALAYEMAARFYRARGFELIADAYLRESRTRYVRWGADGKVKQLDRLHPDLVERRRFAPTVTLAVGAERLDVLSVVKASQAISREIVVDQLLRRLIAIVLEQAGAQKGYVILGPEGNLTLEAEARVDAKGATAVTLLHSLPVAASPLLPASIVSYVWRTRQKVLLANATEGTTFSADEYVARTRPLSVLCLPILKQAELVGLLYLENNLVTGAFTTDRLEILELLTAQAAISLESALCLAKEQTARAAAEETERRTAFLSEAGALLAESLDYKLVLARLTTLSVRDFADWCVIDLIEEGELKRLCGRHVDPAKQELLEALQRRYPVRVDSPHPVATVVREGKLRLVPTHTEAELRAGCVDDEHFALKVALGTRTSLIVPLLARGKTLGAISFCSGRPGHSYGRADAELAQELAHRAATAIDNARLYEQSVQALRLRDEFLSVASHELRTPMTSLTLALQAMMPNGARSAPSHRQSQQKLVEVAVSQAKRLNRLIDELLEVSRIEMDQMPLELTEVDLGSVVREVVQRFEPNLARAECTVAIHEEGRAVGRWDRSRLDQVVTNLLANAIKFSPGKPIAIRVGQAAGTAWLAVQDQGIGIDPAQAGRIFERFARAVSAGHYGGLGLGLYICRSIVEAHGGSIRVASELGAGATFTVELPCAGPRKVARAQETRPDIA